MNTVDNLGAVAWSRFMARRGVARGPWGGRLLMSTVVVIGANLGLEKWFPGKVAVEASFGV